MGTLLLLWPIFPATCTAQNSLHMKKPNTGLSRNSFSKIFIINHGPPLVFLSDSEMEEESKGEPSKVESANVELNQSPKKVFNQKLRFKRIMSSGCYCRDQHYQPQHPVLRLSTLTIHRYDVPGSSITDKLVSCSNFFFQLNLLASTMFSKTADWIGETWRMRHSSVCFLVVIVSYYYHQPVSWRAPVLSISCWNKWTGE